MLGCDQFWFSYSDLNRRKNMYKSKDYYTLCRQKRGKSTIWIYYAYDENGKRIKRSTGARTRADALHVIEERIKDGKLIYPNGYVRKSNYRPATIDCGMTMNQLCEDLYIEGKCPIIKDHLMRGKTIAKNTCRNHRIDIKNYIIPDFGKKMVSELSGAMIDDWILHLPERYNISRSSANLKLSTLKRVLDYAIKIGVIQSNPCSIVKPLASDTKEKKSFSDEEIQLLFNSTWDSPMAKVCCLLSASTGMRVGEVLALQGYQISPDSILVDASISAKERSTTKSKKSRIVPISSELYRTLVSYIRGDHEYLFTLDGESPLSYDALRRKMTTQLKTLGIPRYSFHCFRHYFNTKLIAAGISPEKVRAIIGHESEAMTERYLHLRASDMQEVTEVQKSLIK